MPHPELAAEQAHIDHAYRRLDAMRAAALEALQAAYSERGGTYQAVTERDIRVRSLLHRLEQLQLGQEALVFGRIDRKVVPPNGPGSTESFHIGRLAVADEDLDPLVVDWRAPVAEPFYRATGAHPMGLSRRRHFLIDGQVLEDLEDELFGDGVDGGGGLGLSGSAVLLAALQRSRTGRMRDIVATVQREQDEIIRGPLAGVLVVQGGPGTGKTAVALHRAAYLLYTHRFPLEHQGVLVVGPNPLFLRYIEHVLPSLGETGVELSTVGSLFSEEKATGSEQRSVARLKGDPRMVRFLAQAVSDRQRPLRRPLEVGFGPHRLRLMPAATAEIVAAAHRRGGPHNSRRRLVETLLWRHLFRQYEAAEERARRVGLRADATQNNGGGSDPGARDPGGPDPSGPDAFGPHAVVPSRLDALDPAELGRQLRRRPEIAEALERMWPLLSPQQLLHDLFGALPLIRLAGRELLTPEEQASLHRPRTVAPGGVAWTEADLPLLDEAQALLGSRRRRPSNGSGILPGEIRTYGHIVVDEAQDLSPMQLRMLARRSLSGSMTVVGDIAQGTGEWSPPGWNDVLAHLPTRRGSRVVELDVNYRTPAEIMELAGRVLVEVAAGYRLPESVRSTGVPPRVIGVSASEGGFALGAAVARTTAEEATLVNGESLSGGRVAVICAGSHVGELARALVERGVPFGESGKRGLDEPVTLVPLELAKGLEFDSVVVVEPARIVREAAQGLRALYVAMTRSTKRLSLVHAEPLPAALAADEQPAADGQPASSGP
jgi:DNA helicase IV